MQSIGSSAFNQFQEHLGNALKKDMLNAKSVEIVAIEDVKAGVLVKTNVTFPTLGDAEVAELQLMGFQELFVNLVGDPAMAQYGAVVSVGNTFFQAETIPAATPAAVEVPGVSMPSMPPAVVDDDDPDKAATPSPDETKDTEEPPEEGGNNSSTVGILIIAGGSVMAAAVVVAGLVAAGAVVYYRRRRRMGGDASETRGLLNSDVESRRSTGGSDPAASRAWAAA